MLAGDFRRRPWRGNLPRPPARRYGPRVHFHQLHDGRWHVIVTGCLGHRLGETTIESLDPRDGDLYHAARFLAAVTGTSVGDVHHAAHTARLDEIVSAKFAA